MGAIVTDLEIARPVEEVGGWNHTELMGVSVAVNWDFSEQTFHVYGPQDQDAYRASLLAADAIVSFNGEEFDFPVAFSRPRDEWASLLIEITGGTPSLDLKKLILRNWRGSWKGWGLGPICQATLGAGKQSGAGAEAPIMFKDGRWAKLTDYCLQDVRMTRDLYSFIKKYGYVLNTIDGVVHRVEVKL